MHAVTHLLMGWTVANGARLERRDRAIVTAAGVLPDLDGAGAVVEIATRDSANPLYWWSEYHHVLFHNIGFGLLLAVAAFAVARRRWLTALLSLLAFHLHLLGDLVGSRGPQGYDWPIPYLLPFSRGFELSWSGQWALNAWPNIVLTLVLLAVTFYLAWRRGFSPLELIWGRADGVFVRTLRDRFGLPPASSRT